MQAVSTAIEHEELWGHPRALWLLFVTEMWERFSYYGMRALLVFYMTETFLFGDNRSYAIYGAYTSLVYLTPVFGGMVADRILGYRKSVTVGAILMALGHFAMAVEHERVFFLALALIIVGSGFFKPNMSTIIGKLYAPDDPRRDSGYTVFYMGVNLGALIAPIGCGLVGQIFGLHWGFTLAGFGMLTGLFVFLKTQDRLHGIAEPPDEARLKHRVMPGLSLESTVYVLAAVAVAGIWQLVQMTSLVGWILILVGGGVMLYLFGYSIVKCDRIQRDRVWVALVLTLFGVVFWAFFEQAGSSLNLFADRNVDKVVFGRDLPASVMQSINPGFILLLGGVFAWMWTALDRVGLNPSTPLKFGLGIIQLGLGFGALYYGASISQDDGMVALSWLVLGYLLHTTGELCLSPVGLSMMSKLAPPKMGAMMMGIWYLSSAFAQYVAGGIAQLTGVSGEGGEPAVDLVPTDTVMVYGTVFGQIALVALGVGVFLSIISPIIRKGSHGVT
jgi:POT family proton-dependent oligopeptide transporter